MGGGGGSAGKNSWPDYIQNIHRQWLTGWVDNAGSRPTGFSAFPNVATTMLAATTAQGGNPYTGAVAYNPDSDILNAQDAVDDYNDVLSASFAVFLQETADAVDALIASPEDFDSMLTVLGTKIRREHNKGMVRANAAFLDVGAIMTTNYQMYVAQGEQEVRDRINEAIVQHEERRDTQRLQMVQGMLVARIGGRQNLAGIQLEALRLFVTAKNDEIQMNQQFENDEATWDLSLFQNASNLLAAVSGGVQTPQKQSSTQRLLGAASGAASGALGGFAAGGPIGAGIGGAIGLLGGLFG